MTSITHSSSRRDNYETVTETDLIYENQVYLCLLDVILQMNSSAEH